MALDLIAGNASDSAVKALDANYGDAAKFSLTVRELAKGGEPPVSVHQILIAFDSSFSTDGWRITLSQIYAPLLQDLVDAISSVFPLFCKLVAPLIDLTTFPLLQEQARER